MNIILRAMMASIYCNTKSFFGYKKPSKHNWLLLLNPTLRIWFVVMFDLEKAKEPKYYEFSWEVIGYDCALPEIQSPTFRVNFEVTEWYMKLDLSKLQNIDSRISFRLQRVPNIGPNAVTLDVKITVKLSHNKDFRLEKSQIAKIFSETGENFWAFDIDIPSQKLESEDAKFKWLSSKYFTIDVEMKRSSLTDPESAKNYWYSESSLKGVTESLKTLYSEGIFHDLVLKVTGNELKLHKCILKARWPKLVSELKFGKSLDEVETVEFSGIPHALLVDMMKFAYYGELDFMSKPDLDVKIFHLVNKHNFYRLNNQITQLSPECSTSQIFQSFRTSVEMQFTNVTSTAKAMVDFKTCEIPLKPRQLQKPPRPMDEKEKEKFHRHIRFMDLTLYVNKGPLGYNWLMFSVVLGKLPKANPVTMKCKLYVIGLDEKKNKVKYLLTDQNLKFDSDTKISFTTSFSKGKTCERYKKFSEPIITWRELTDEQNKFMSDKKVGSLTSRTGESSGSPSQKIEKNIHFRFEIKLADGEYLHDTRHGEFQFGYEGDYKIFKDLENMYSDEFTDVQVTSGDRIINTHKAILAARSKVFKDDLTKKPHSKSLSIDIKPELLHIFVHYIYTGQILQVPGVKRQDILSKADEYGIKCFEEMPVNGMASD